MMLYKYGRDIRYEERNEKVQTTLHQSPKRREWRKGNDYRGNGCKFTKLLKKHETTCPGDTV